jgi:hypothetical protein
MVLFAVVGCRPLAPVSDPARYPEASLIRALPVEAPRPLEPSGLTVFGGSFYTVADKVDDTLYRVEWGEAAARLVPHRRFVPPPGGRMDWEGITVDESGTFYLISEGQGRLARIPGAGPAQWTSIDLRPAGREAGLFRKRNAGFEGIARLGDSHWLGAVEREPRGLVEWRADGTQAAYRVHTDSPFKAALPLIRIPDYSGLHADPHSGKVYALFRNAHLIVQLEKAGESWTETRAWSYAHIETDPRWAYRSQTYGQAEGLVVEKDLATLIFDNNLGGRQADPGDARPLIIQMRLPGEP